MEYKRIVTNEKDMWGRWQVRVDLGDEGPFFEFDKKPTEKEVIAEVNKYIENCNKPIDRMNEIQEVQRKISELTIKKQELEVSNGDINIK